MFTQYIVVLHFFFADAGSARVSFLGQEGASPLTPAVLLDIRDDIEILSRFTLHFHA